MTCVRPKVERLAVAARRRSARLAVALLLLLAVPAVWAQERPLDPAVFEIGDQLRCPTCVSESVAESNSAIAREMRVLIQEQLDLGRDREEILAFFQARYGDWILLNPPRRGILLIVWLAPVAAALIGGLLLVYFVGRWRASAEQVPDIDAADRERVSAALASSGPGATTPPPDGPASPPRP